MTTDSCGKRCQTVLFPQLTLQVGCYNPDGNLLGILPVGKTFVSSPNRMDLADMANYDGQTQVQANPSPTEFDPVYMRLPDSGRTVRADGVRIKDYEELPHSPLAPALCPACGGTGRVQRRQ